MKSTPIRIVPAANLARNVSASGTVVVCIAGAFPGYRLHWAIPERGPLASAAESPLTSEQLVNGQAYVCPAGSFTQFWITTPTAIANANESLELRVIDQALPVVVLNPHRFSGFKYHVHSENTIALTHPGSAVAYQGNVQPLPAFQQGYQAEVNPRGFIVGGASAATPFQIEMYSALDAGAAFYSELVRWFVDTADPSGRYSCSFENGGRNGVFAASGTAGLVPWPARGLKMVVRTTTLTLSDFYYSLASRTGGG